jgi:hypothetical protein
MDIYNYQHNSYDYMRAGRGGEGSGVRACKHMRFLWTGTHSQKSRKSVYRYPERFFSVARALTFGNFRQPADGADLSSKTSAFTVILFSKFKKK